MSVSTSVARPSAVQTAWALWLTFVGLALVSLIATVAMSDGSKGTVGLGGVVLAAVAACSTKFRDGANWARIVLTVLGALNIAANVAGLAMLLGMDALGDMPAVLTILSVLMPIVVVAALSFSYRREANEYFAAVKVSHV